LSYEILRRNAVQPTLGARRHAMSRQNVPLCRQTACHCAYRLRPAGINRTRRPFIDQASHAFVQGDVSMKVSRLIQVVLMIATLGLASLSLSACGDMNTSGGASSSGTSGSSGGY
jgi:hypothetical protein